MPNPKKDVKDATGKSNLTWVNPYLNTGDKKWLSDNIDQLPVQICALLDKVDEHHNLSIKFDRYSKRFLATFICNDSESLNAQCAISVRGATATDATYALAYCVLVKMPEKWSDSNDAVGSRWG